jgi:O-antigen/teichoic acid export membrane protein
MPRPVDHGPSGSNAAVEVPSSRRNISFSALEQGVRVVLGFAVSTKVARDLGPAEFSDLALGLALASLFLPLATVGSDPLLVQRLAEGDASDRRWSGAAIRARTLGTAVALVAATITAIVVTDGVQSATTTVLTVAILVTVPVDVAFIRALARLRLDRVAPWRIGVLILGATARLAALVGGADARGIALVLLCETIAISAVTWRLSRGPQAQPGDAVERARTLFVDSFPFLVSGLLYMVYLRIDMLIIRVVLGAEDLGTYSIAVRVSELGAVTAALVIPSWAAAVALTHPVGTVAFHRSYAALFKRGAAWGSLAAGATAVAGWVLIEPIFGTEYQNARGIVVIYAVSIVPVWLLAIRERYIAALGRGSLQIGPSLAGAIVAIVANAVLLPMVGLVGAAWATVLSYSVALAWSFATRRQRAAIAPLAHATTTAESASRDNR